MATPAPVRQVYSVSEVADILRGLLEDALPSIWVQGELSNFRNPSGHWYFTLKDEQAQLRCAMFKGQNHLVKPQPRNGDAVLARGRLTYYGRGGDAQLVVEHLEPAGEGALLRAFEDLKKRLAAEGLFDEAVKRPLPAAPRGIGIITSSTGAALQDMLSTLRRRYPLGCVWLHAVPVQGDAACPAIVRALTELPRRAPVDVIILARGGGSLEDLWCFNHESLARAIRACAVPVVTGIGHETDFTIADFAADLRAPTPTGAAERVAPNLAEWAEHVGRLQETLAGALEELLLESGEALRRLRERLDTAHPGRRLQVLAQRLDGLGERLAHCGPERLRRLGERVRTQELLLQSYNPRGILQRGYAIVRAAGGAVVTDTARLGCGDAVEVVLAQGEFDARVTGIKT
jgi:exodeoxyribonuclease VII large subunit